MKIQSQNQNKLNKLRSEAGITMLSLLVTIIILVILTAIAVKFIAGDNGIIGVASDSGVDHEVKAYWEQITRTVQGEIISKATVSEVATADTIITALNEEDWVRLAKKSAESTDEVVRITVQVVDGYIYQIYYNVDYSKLQIDYMGKDIPEDNWDDMTLVARYEIANASIYATAEDKKNGVAKLELIYKEQVVGSIDNPNGEQSWKVDKIGPGWYKIRATSNSGMIKTTWVKARNFSDSLSMPSIEVETEGVEHNGWYGADGKDLFIKISTNSSSAKEIHYVLTGAQIKGETTESLPNGTGIRSIRFQITETGTTTIRAWTEDGKGYQSEENEAEVKFDNVKPEIVDTEVEGTEGQNSWYTSDVEIAVSANDPKGVLDGYIYQILSSAGAVLTPETHIKNAEQTIKNEPNLAKDGIYTVIIQAIDQAGNKSPSRTLTIQKDTENPTIGEPQVANIVENGFRVSVSAGDVTSGIDRYEYYLNGSLAHTSQEGVWEPSDLTANTYYNVTVRVYDRAGLMKESISAPVTTKGELLAPNVEISGNTRNGYYIGDVTVSVRDTSDGTKTRVSRIKVTGAGSERTITGTSGSFTITADGTYTISAWSEDESGNRSTTTSKPAFTRDTTPPSSSNITYQSKILNSITVTANGQDATSGIKNYTYQYKETSTNDADNQWKTATTTGADYTYPSSMIMTGRIYDLRVIANDNAGWTKTSGKITVNTNTAPTITASYASKDTNYIKINATGKDVDGDKLTYKLYVSTDGTNWGTAKATLSNQTQGQEVTLTANGLSQYTYYYWKVETTDNYDTADTGKQGRIRTYCSGGKQERCTKTVKGECGGTTFDLIYKSLNLDCGWCFNGTQYITPDIYKCRRCYKEYNVWTCYYCSKVNGNKPSVCTAMINKYCSVCRWNRNISHNRM